MNHESENDPVSASHAEKLKAEIANLTRHFTPRTPVREFDGEPLPWDQYQSIRRAETGYISAADLPGEESAHRLDINLISYRKNGRSHYAVGLALRTPVSGPSSSLQIIEMENPTPEAVQKAFEKALRKMEQPPFTFHGIQAAEFTKFYDAVQYTRAIEGELKTLHGILLSDNL
ncbi:hypothetical protein [Ruficoccus sp. ZRK36]|uniref:hypothetical protein n=1 Tax=Ruficoccus sp. ZRK36 TaxID=2866311 RepID=UPI001C7305F0|nr:hypothetical protein [Ruficoccus sp. ZRK36]QYY35291.1 hypothetical protein K0V07_13440 [Ruficoccus sp. ZRK36]